jgi:hypothetical protein
MDQWFNKPWTSGSIRRACIPGMHLILATSMPLSPHPSVPEGAGDSARNGLTVWLHLQKSKKWKMKRIGKNNHGRSGVFSGKASILLCGLEWRSDWGPVVQ